MVGKKSSITILKRVLQFEGIPKHQIFTYTFAQGITHRWGIAWTFLPEYARLYAQSVLLHEQQQIQRELQSQQTDSSLQSTQGKVRFLTLKSIVAL
jgi:hypothetical protein